MEELLTIHGILALILHEAGHGLFLLRHPIVALNHVNNSIASHTEKQDGHSMAALFENGVNHPTGAPET